MTFWHPWEQENIWQWLLASVQRVERCEYEDPYLDANFSNDLSSLITTPFYRPILVAAAGTVCTARLPPPPLILPSLLHTLLGDMR